MSVKDQLLDAIERNESRAEAGVSKYFSVLNDVVVERATKVISKLPVGDKIAPRYSDIAGKAVSFQKDSAIKLVHAQAKTQAWPLKVRESAESSTAPAI